MPAIASMQDDVTTAEEVFARRKAIRAKFFSTVTVDIGLAAEAAKLRNELRAVVVENAKLREENDSLKKSFGVPQDPDIPADIKVRDIQAGICGVFKVSHNDLVSARRTASLVKPRHIGAFICRQFTKQSLPQIGREFCRDHTTMLHSVRTMEPVWLMVSGQIGGKNLRDVIEILSAAYDAHYKPIRAAYGARISEIRRANLAVNLAKSRSGEAIA